MCDCPGFHTDYNSPQPPKFNFPLIFYAKKKINDQCVCLKKKSLILSIPGPFTLCGFKTLIMKCWSVLCGSTNSFPPFFPSDISCVTPCCAHTGSTEGLQIEHV